MRKELLGPLPVVVGLALVLATLLVPPTPAQAPCSCRVFSPQEFEAQDEAGYPEVTNGSAIAIVGELARVEPIPPIASPQRTFSFRGSALSFNVTTFQATSPYAGGWARISTVHQGESESQAPSIGHSWTYEGPAPAPGSLQYPPLGMVLGIALAGWGAATWPLFTRTRAESGEMREKLRRLRGEASSEPAVRAQPTVKNQLAAAARELRWGQNRAARESLDHFEAALRRAQELGALLGDAERALTAFEARMGAKGTTAREKLKDAADQRARGAVPEAEKALAAVMAEIHSGSRTLDLLKRIEALWREEREFSSDEVEVVKAHISAVEDGMSTGPWSKAEEIAAGALRQTLEISPAARRAREQIEAFDESLQANRTAAVGRELGHQITAARSAYAVDDFARASSLALAGQWVVDENALGEPGLRRALIDLWQSRGWMREEGGPAPPMGGFVLRRAGERLLVVTAAWREFPTERVLLAVRDYLRSGGAGGALVYSSAFANTSTDPKITVVTLRESLNELTEAAGLSAHGAGV